jgi:hypothetical protein
MEKTGITFAVTPITPEESIYQEGIEEESRYLKECNEYQIEMVENHPINSVPF